MNKTNIREGVREGFPVALGYLPIAITFGVLSKTSGITLGESVLFSSVVYAGASQFMALNMILLGSGFFQIVIATFLLNLRHFLMSASLSQRLEANSGRLLPFISFGVTDEAFSVASAREGRVDPVYFMALHLTAYLSWNIGTVIGYMAGELLPPMLSSSMVVGLYAMFTALLVPQMKGSLKVTALVVLSGIVNTLIKGSGYVPKGWDIVLTITIVSGVGTLLDEIQKKRVQDEVKTSEQ